MNGFDAFWSFLFHDTLGGLHTWLDMGLLMERMVPAPEPVEILFVFALKNLSRYPAKWPIFGFPIAVPPVWLGGEWQAGF